MPKWKKIEDRKNAMKCKLSVICLGSLSCGLQIDEKGLASTHEDALIKVMGLCLIKVIRSHE